MEWLRKLFGFALVPDLIFFLDAEPELLLHRAFAKYGQLDYWESGMDLGLSGDMLDSFRRYQALLRSHFIELARDYKFVVVDAKPSAEEVQRQIRATVEPWLRRELG